MKVLLAHNRYQERGGEDSVVDEESALLERHGQKVERLMFNNDHIQGGRAKAIAAAQTFYNPRSARLVRQALRTFRPDILHVHNFFPTLSPAVFFATKAERVPVVLTLHNFRLVCSNAQLFRNGSVCEECPQSGSFLPAVRYGCYRGSAAGSAVVGSMLAVHGLLGTWTGRVDRYIALTSFASSRLQSRVPVDLIRVKPNFVQARPIGTGKGEFALFVGRLTKEKGVGTLIEADQASRLALPVHVVGDGEEMARLREASARPGSRLTVVGPLSRPEVSELMRSAAVLIVPSLWYEGFPMVVCEAFASGLPVIASAIGSLAEIIDPGVSGLLFRPGDALDLCSTVERFARDAPLQAVLRLGARLAFEQHYSEEVNYRRLMEIYGELTLKKPAGATLEQQQS